MQTKNSPAGGTSSALFAFHIFRISQLRYRLKDSFVKMRRAIDLVFGLCPIIRPWAC